MAGTRRAMSVFQPQLVDAFGRRTKKIQYENTYRMEPKALFPVVKATAIIKDMLESRLTGVEYVPETCMILCKSLAYDIKESMKDLGIERYKYVAVVTVGPTVNSEVIVASRCLLNSDHDTFATYTFDERGLFAVGTVYAFYRE